MGGWTYRVSAAGVLVLAAAAFTLSYDALHQLALNSRVRPALAWLWPVVIDGTIVVALLTVLAAKRAGMRATYPWSLAGLFSLASVAFNIAHAPDRPVAQLVFAMAPVALVLTTHLLMQQVGWRHRAGHAGSMPVLASQRGDLSGMVPAVRPVGPEVASAGRDTAVRTMPPSPSWPPPPRSAGERRGLAADGVSTGHLAGSASASALPEARSGHAVRTTGEAKRRQRARQIYDEAQAAGRKVTGAELGRALGRSDRYGRLLLAEFRAAGERKPTQNGDRSPPDAHPPTT
jgi:Protein of unknown function (DUF2637)